MNIVASARAAGYSERSAYDIEKRPAVAKAIDYFREQNREEVRFELADAHWMYLKA
jgi:phage terminase small subunit